MEKKVEHMTMQDLKEMVIIEREGVAAKELEEVTKLAPSPIDLLGTWVNVDSNTRGMVKIILGYAGTLRVHAYGACHPNPCDWGTVNGLTYGNSVSSSRAVAFSATYKFSFKTTIVTGSYLWGYLVVETYDHFTDNSGRYDYFSRYIFKRA